VRLYDLTGPEPRPQEWQANGQAVVLTLVLPGSGWLVTGNDRGRVVVWRRQGPAEPARLFNLQGHEGPVIAGACTPDGRRLVTGSVDGTTRLWDLPEGPPAEPLTLPQGVLLPGRGDGLTLLAVSPDGRRLVTAGVSGTLRLWTLRRQDLLEIVRSLGGEEALGRLEWARTLPAEVLPPHSDLLKDLVPEQEDPPGR
jgi:WD40 repeat protein